MTKNEINEKSAATTVLADTVRTAMARAYSLGQTWWQQADSEYRSENKKADVTATRFMELTDAICAKVDALAHAGKAVAADEKALAEMEARKDAAYLERNQVVAALAKCFPSGVARTAIEGWSEDWHGCVYIDLPTGQVSWHFHDSQAYLFDGLPQYTGKWDGHDTPEKYHRVAALEVLAQAGVTAEPALTHDGWLIDGSLIYRLNDEGFNCDEINVAMVSGSRAADLRHDTAVKLLTELTSIAQVPAAEVCAAQSDLSELAVAVDVVCRLLEKDGPLRAGAAAELRDELRAAQGAQAKQAAEVRAAAIESLGSVIKKAVHVLPFDIAGALLAAFGEVAHQSTADKATGVRAEWQPIETAPKDKEIWAFNGEQGRMKWSEGDCWALWVWVDELLADADPSPDQPTHWRPLPNPPSTADSAGAGAMGEKGAEA